MHTCSCMQKRTKAYKKASDLNIPDFQGGHGGERTNSRGAKGGGSTKHTPNLAPRPQSTKQPDFSSDKVVAHMTPMYPSSCVSLV
jgi:hypothetical protein